MGWKALLKTEWNESLQNSYWWLFIISNNLTFFCVLLPGVWPSLWCAMVYLPVCRGVCIRAGVRKRVGVCVCVLFMCTRTCFMVNKQLFSAKVFQLLIRSRWLWCCDRWITVKTGANFFVDFSFFGGLVSQSENVSNCPWCLLLSDNTRSFREWGQHQMKCPR